MEPDNTRRHSSSRVRCDQKYENTDSNQDFPYDEKEGPSLKKNRRAYFQANDTLETVSHSSNYCFSTHEFARRVTPDDGRAAECISRKTSAVPNPVVTTRTSTIPTSHTNNRQPSLTHPFRYPRPWQLKNRSHPYLSLPRSYTATGQLSSSSSLHEQPSPPIDRTIQTTHSNMMHRHNISRPRNFSSSSRETRRHPSLRTVDVGAFTTTAKLPGTLQKRERCDEDSIDSIDGACGIPSPRVLCWPFSNNEVCSIFNKNKEDLGDGQLRRNDGHKDNHDNCNEEVREYYSSRRLGNQHRPWLPYPVQSNGWMPHKYQSNSKPLQVEQLGPPHCRIYRFTLPYYLIDGLDHVVRRCEAHAATLPKGWKTCLYSLTQQDIALSQVPGLLEDVRPIVDLVSELIHCYYGVTALSSHQQHGPSPKRIHMDMNQPHILKYSAESGHVGVGIHHDRCDVTASLMLSSPNEYVGGGTYFPDLGERARPVQLQKGQMLLHPGSLPHAGNEIGAGTRYLMVFFVDFK